MIIRTIEQYIEQALSSSSAERKKAIIIYGPRQVGKTTLAKHLLKKHPDRTEYFNCDYPDVQEIFSYQKSHQLESIVKNLKLLVLDEAQRIENIGLVLKILVDQFPNVQVIATGSSSFDLSNKINEPLTGRKIIFHLFPFSFEELHGTQNLLQQKRDLESLLRFGSYPEVYNQPETNKTQVLMEITNSYLFKDVFNFQDLRKPELLTKLLRLLAFQIGHEVSFHELATQLGVDQLLVQKYIHLLEEAFVIFRLSAFRRNLRSEINKSRKIYFWDIGVRNALIQNFNTFPFRNDVGTLWENFCIAERLKYQSSHQILANAYFWRTYHQQEIDYIEESAGNLSAYEFKWNPRAKAKKPTAFAKSYPDSQFSVVHSNNFNQFILPAQ